MFSLFVFIIAICIVLLIVVANVLKHKEKYQNTEGIIAGNIYGKKSEKPEEGVTVRLGKIEASGSSNKFIVEKSYSFVTDKTGKFIFENVAIKSWWVMAEKNGKKVMKVVKLTESDKRIEDVLLIV